MSSAATVALAHASSWWSTDHVLALANVVLAVVGLTTIIFGLATIRSPGAMARTASDQAHASGQLAEAASAQNLAGVRPLLVEVPKGLLGAAQIDQQGPGTILWAMAPDGTVLLTVPLRNSGPGPAFVDRVTIGPMRDPIAQAEMTSRAIAPGDVAHMVALVPPSHAAAGINAQLGQALARGAVTAEVTYADVYGTQRTLTRLTVAQAGATTLVKVIELYHCDSKWAPIEPPFVQTRVPDEPQQVRVPDGPKHAGPASEEQEPLAGDPVQRDLSDEELAAAVRSAHAEGSGFGEAVIRDAPAQWVQTVLERKPRMPSDLEARLLQGSALPIEALLHDEVRHALRRGFWDAVERVEVAAQEEASEAGS